MTALKTEFPTGRAPRGWSRPAFPCAGLIRTANSGQIKTLYVEHPDQTASVLLGSANYTRRNLDNFNAECNLACTAPVSHSAMKRTRETFERWWSNPNGLIYTTAYEIYEDTSAWRKFKARFMEASGLSSF